MKQEIRFCTTSDGVGIAYATTGEGPTLVHVQGWVSHLEFEMESPPNRTTVDAFSADHTFVRYDGRGTGLSDRNVTDFSLEARVRDLKAVVDALKVRPVALYGISAGASTAIAYAVRHPGRVSRLVLYGAVFPNRKAQTAEERERLQAMVTLIRQGWGKNNPALRQMFTGLFMPDADAKQLRWFNEMQRVSATPESVIAFLTAQGSINIRDMLPKVKAATLVIHRRGDAVVEFESGRALASLIPGARVLPLEGTNHILLPEEPETAQFFEAVSEFLAEDRQPTKQSSKEPALPTGMTAILFLDIADSTALTTQLGDAAYREKERELDTSLRAAITDAGGTPIEGKVLGDGVMAVFTSARQAIEAAHRCRDLGNEACLPLHLGIHAGDVVREGNNVHGGAVQVAARVQSVAAPGEILVSQTVRDLARTSSSVQFEDRGEHELKGIPEPQRLFAVQAED